MTTSLQRRQGAPGQRLHSPVSPTPQYDAYGPQLGHLSENIHRLLTERECSIFDRGLADYHRRRNIRSFVECLSLVLNNNQKRQLLLPIRDSYVKPSDLVKFNQLVQDHGLATSLRRKKKEEKTKLGSGVRRLEVKRDPNGEWGFSIRGGSEHGIGVFVSWVEPSSGAHKSGLQVGDQILKTNDVSFENISHYEAVTMLKGVKKASLWVLSRGRVPSSRMTHKMYRWMSPEGRSVSPPPDPFDLQDQTSIGERGVMNEADERKVTMVVEDGHELGISIRGGAEHGLGIYVSVVEEDSVADNYGLKPGDQLLEVNDVKFLNIIHSDAANALRAQRCMVMKVKDVGKIPHSRITTYGQTEWKSPTIKSSNGPQTSSPPVFQSGMGTQVMHGKQQTGSIQGRGLMNEVARSVLNTQELTTFNYYVDQYDQHSMSVENLVAPLLDLLNTPEKLQLLSEVRALIKAHDLQRFNELTVHKEISSKKGYRSHKDTSFPDGSSKPTSPVDMDRTPDVHNGSDDFILSPLPNSPNGHTRPHQGSDISSEEGGRDKVPQRLSPQRPGAKGMFHAPPPPSSPPATSTPDGQSSLAHTLKERRQWMREGTKEQSMDETWDGQWNDSSIMQQHMGADETDGPADISEIEAKVRSETEAQLREEFKEDKRKLMEEQQRLLEQEKQDKEMTLRREREQFQKEMREQEEKVKAEVEERVMMEAEGKIKRELEVKERELTEEFAKRNESQLEQTDFEEQIREIEERTKMEMEEKIWKEAEEQLRHEFDIKIEEEKTKFQSEAASKSTSPETTPNKEAENRLRRELEQKFKQEYDEKMRRERDKMRKQQQDDKKRREDEERAKRQDDIARLEAEEQEKIENEERIRKEADAAARAEYEVRLQKETMERAKLAEEVKARREAEERREAKIKKVKPQMAQTPPVHEDPAEESEEDMPDTEPMHTGPASEEEEKMLEVQRRRREAEEREVEREQRRREAEEQREANQAYSKQEEERQKKLELQRKREENIRKREEERKQKDAEARRKRDQQKSSNPSSSTPTSQHTKPKTSEGETRTKSRTNDGETRTKSRTNDGETHTKPKTTEGKPQKSKQQVIEDERRKAEDKLQRRLKKAQEKKQAEETASAGGQGQSYGGYEDLQGRIFNVTVTKVCKKLGIAIDGGANTKQKAVIIREISPEGCAALTGEGLKVGQQILSVGGQCLFNLRHKEVVMAVKSAFEGPLQKTLELVVLDQA